MQKHYARIFLATCFIGGAITTAVAGEKNVVIAVHSNFTTMDPSNANDTLSGGMAKSFYEGLFGFDKNMKLMNVLAQSYAVTPDGLTYTVKLRPNVKFHDGTDFNARAAKINLDRVSNQGNHLKRYNLFVMIDHISIIDPLTLQIVLKYPFSSFINNLAHPAAAMISPTALEKWGTQIGFHPVGTGPYKFVLWNQTEFVKVEKFPDYWKTGIPKLDSITWMPVVENSTRIAMLKTGEAQLISPVAFEQVTLLEKIPGLKVEQTQSIMERYLTLNVTKKPFDDPRIRAAINYAMNRQALVKVVFSGYAIPAVSIIPPTLQFAQSYPAIPYDPEKARSLLKEAGYTNGFSTTLWSAYNDTTTVKVLQFIQQQLAQVNIRIAIQPMDAAQRVAMVESKGVHDTALQMFYTGWSASTGEAGWALTPLVETTSWPPSQFNTSFYSNSVVDESLHNAISTTDTSKKEAFYKKVQDQIWQDQPWAPLTIDQQVYAHSEKLTEFYVMPDGAFSFENADLQP